MRHERALGRDQEVQDGKHVIRQTNHRAPLHITGEVKGTTKAGLLSTSESSQVVLDRMMWGRVHFCSFWCAG